SLPVLVHRYLANGSASTALFYAQLLLAALPNERSKYTLALCYHELGQHRAVARVLEQCPSPHCRHLRARALMRLDAHSDAEDALLLDTGLAGKTVHEVETLLSQQPHLIPGGACGVYLLGEACLGSGRLDTAKQYFNLALRLDPLLWDAYEALCKMDAAPLASAAWDASTQAGATSIAGLVMDALALPQAWPTHNVASALLQPLPTSLQARADRAHEQLVGVSGVQAVSDSLLGSMSHIAYSPVTPVMKLKLASPVLASAVAYPPARGMPTSSDSGGGGGGSSSSSTVPPSAGAYVASTNASHAEYGTSGSFTLQRVPLSGMHTPLLDASSILAADRTTLAPHTGGIQPSGTLQHTGALTTPAAANASTHILLDMSAITPAASALLHTVAVGGARGGGGGVEGGRTMDATVSSSLASHAPGTSALAHNASIIPPHVARALSLSTATPAQRLQFATPSTASVPVPTVGTAGSQAHASRASWGGGATQVSDTSTLAHAHVRAAHDTSTITEMSNEDDVSPALGSSAASMTGFGRWANAPASGGTHATDSEVGQSNSTPAGGPLSADALDEAAGVSPPALQRRVRPNMAHSGPATFPLDLSGRTSAASGTLHIGPMPRLNFDDSTQITSPPARSAPAGAHRGNPMVAGSSETRGCSVTNSTTIAAAEARSAHAPSPTQRSDVADISARALLQLLGRVGTLMQAVHKFDKSAAVVALRTLPRWAAGAACTLEAMGRCYADAGDLDQVRAHVRLALMRMHKPRVKRCLTLRAHAPLHAVFVQARLMFAHLQRTAPEHRSGLDVYSTVLWQLKLAQELQALALDASAQDARSPQTHCIIANNHSVSGKHAQAIAYLKSAVQLYPTYVYAHTLAGHEYLALGELEKAESHFSLAVRHDRRHYNGWYGMGSVAMKREDYLSARTYFTRALTINSSSPVLLCCLATVMQARGEEAARVLACLRKAVELHPRNAQARFQRASFFMSRGDYSVRLHVYPRAWERAHTMCVRACMTLFGGALFCALNTAGCSGRPTCVTRGGAVRSKRVHTTGNGVQAPQPTGSCGTCMHKCSRVADFRIPMTHPSTCALACVFFFCVLDNCRVLLSSTLWQ
ncbi:hypothetical protein EON66_00385, partial [archaeon]